MRFVTMWQLLYEATPDGRRTRSASAWTPSLGWTPWSESTVYVRPWVAFFLEMALAAGAVLERHGPTGSSSLRMPDGSAVFFPHFTAPVAHCHPVERFADSTHVGYRITRLDPNPREAKSCRDAAPF